MNPDPAPEELLQLPADADWLHWLDRAPLASSAALAGHVVLLLVWRQLSPHGTAALAEVAAVAAEFAAEPVAALTLHVPLDPFEHDEARLRRVLAAAPLPLPTAIVTRRAALRPLGVGSLPTLLVVDSALRIVSRAVGVPRRARLREVVVSLLDEARASGRTALSRFAAHAAVAAPALLPSALAAVGDQLWIACQATRRVLRCTLDGQVTGVVGSGSCGAQDGAGDRATFAAPAGICVHEGHLAVADAGSHTLRAIDRDSLEVTTWCGTGRVSADTTGGAYGRDQGLSSPCAVASRDGGIYLSQLGTEQLWQVDPMTGVGLAWFGAGVGEHRAPPLREPRGLAFVGDTLWLCQAGCGELTAIDLAHLRSDPGLVGLQRPVAVIAHDDRLLVAVAGQPAVLRFDPYGFVQKVLFTAADGLVEPVALACSGDRLFVADAGADRIWTADLAADHPRLQPLTLVGLPPPVSPALAMLAAPLELAADSDVTVEVPVPGMADGREVAVDVVDEAAPTLAAPRHCVATVSQGAVAVLVPAASPVVGTWRLCVANGSDHRRFVVPVRLCVGGAMMARLQPAT